MMAKSKDSILKRAVSLGKKSEIPAKCFRCYVKGHYKRECPLEEHNDLNDNGSDFEA